MSGPGGGLTARVNALRVALEKGAERTGWEIDVLFSPVRRITHVSSVHRETGERREAEICDDDVLSGERESLQAKIVYVLGGPPFAPVVKPGLAESPASEPEGWAW